MPTNSAQSSLPVVDPVIYTYLHPAPKVTLHRICGTQSRSFAEDGQKRAGARVRISQQSILVRASGRKPSTGIEGASSSNLPACPDCNINDGSSSDRRIRRLIMAWFPVQGSATVVDD